MLIIFRSATGATPSFSSYAFNFLSLRSLSLSFRFRALKTDQVNHFSSSFFMLMIAFSLHVLDGEAYKNFHEAAHKRLYESQE